MCQNKIARYEMVELLIPAGAGNRVTFTDIPQLRTQADQEIYVQDIELFLITAYSKSQTNNAVPGITAAEAIKAVLCLYVMGEERIHFIPLVKLNHINDNASPFQEQPNSFQDLPKIDWAKSYVQYNAAPAGGPYVIPFGVTYLKLTVKPQ